jgi:uncharacterized membrane protein YhaH (DUF805 family)
VDFWTWYVRRGRITRRAFWLHYVVPLLLLSALALAADVSFGYTSLEPSTAADGSLVPAVIEYGPFVIVTGILTVLPSITAQVTRMHDQGRSGLWVLLNLVPVFGQFAVLGMCGLVPTQPTPNRYGPVPDASGSALPFAPGTTPPETTPGGRQIWSPQPGTEDRPPAPGPWTPGPQDRAPDYPPTDWR